MDAKELRIGNWLKGKKNVQVTAIVNESTIGAADSYFNVDSDACGGPCLLPIPLTEDWLERFGFKSGELCINNIDGDYYLIQGAAKEVQLLTSDNEWIGNRVHSVHQLQNLYHALTGEELEIESKLDHE